MRVSLPVGIVIVALALLVSGELKDRDEDCYEDKECKPGLLCKDDLCRCPFGHDAGFCLQPIAHPNGTCHNNEMCFKLYGNRSECDEYMERCQCMEEDIFAQTTDINFMHAYGRCEMRCVSDQDCNANTDGNIYCAPLEKDPRDKICQKSGTQSVGIGVGALLVWLSMLILNLNLVL